MSENESIDYTRLNTGDVVRHFKRKSKDVGNLEYCYIILNDCVQHTETGELFVCYMACYGEHKIFVRPRDMFYSEVDREKYPRVKQQYRLEKVIDKELERNCKLSVIDFTGKFLVD